MVIDAAESIPAIRFFYYLKLLFFGFVPYFGFCVQCVRRKNTKCSVELNITMSIPDVYVYLK